MTRRRLPPSLEDGQLAQRVRSQRGGREFRAGQSPLPIFDAAFGARGGVVAIAPGSGYTSAAFITNLQNGEAGSVANALATNRDQNLDWSTLRRAGLEQRPSPFDIHTWSRRSARRPADVAPRAADADQRPPSLTRNEPSSSRSRYAL